MIYCRPEEAECLPLKGDVNGNVWIYEEAKPSIPEGTPGAAESPKSSRWSGENRK